MIGPLGAGNPLSVDLHSYLKDHEQLNERVVVSEEPTVLLEPLQDIDVVPIKGAEVNQCWYNAQKAQDDLEIGKMIFGWAFWGGLDHGRSIAQHHAVIELPCGKRICVTPHEVSLDEQKITFAADGRVPFKFEEPRDVFPILVLQDLADPHPACDKKFYWGDFEHGPLTRPRAWRYWPDNFRELFHNGDRWV